MNARLGGRGHIFALIGLVLGLFAILSILAPNTFPTMRNITSMTNQMAPIGLLAMCIGLTFLIGGIDLSIVAVANAAAITAALTIDALSSLGSGMAVLLGIGAALLVGVLAGSINGLLVSLLRVHPIPITLGTLALFTGITTGITGGSTVYGSGNLSILGRGTLFSIPISFITFVVVLLIFAFVTTRTRFGFRLYAIGASEKVSRFARMRVERVQLLTYIASGVLAAIAGIIMFAGTNAANVSFGSSYLIQAILVGVITGINPYGGRGRILLVVLAVAAMQQVQTGINMALGRWEGANFAAEFAWGVLLIIVLGFSQRMGTGPMKFLRKKDELPPAEPPAKAEVG